MLHDNSRLSIICLNIHSFISVLKESSRTVLEHHRSFIPLESQLEEKISWETTVNAVLS